MSKNYSKLEKDFPDIINDSDYQELVRSAIFVADFFNLRGIENWEFLDLKCRWKTESKIYVEQIDSQND
jgi:hypothetical protein